MPGALAHANLRWPAGRSSSGAAESRVTVARPPQFLTLEEHRDAAHRYELAARRTVLVVLLLLAGVALLGLLGQKPAHSTGVADEATLEVSAPTRLRGGLFYQGRFTIRAQEEIESATLVLDRGWLDGMHVNTIEPTPVGEASREGRLALDFGRVAADDFIVAYLQFQVNPTTVGRRSQGVELHDGETPLAAVDRTVTIFP